MEEFDVKYLYVARFRLVSRSTRPQKELIEAYVRYGETPKETGLRYERPTLTNMLAAQVTNFGDNVHCGGRALRT